jgi:hypothetical protein
MLARRTLWPAKYGPKIRAAEPDAAQRGSQREGRHMKRGSEKRQRNHVLKARFNDQEAAAIQEMAASRGLSVASLIRHATLNVPPPRRALPRPRVETVLLARALGELGKIGSNLNQLTKYANMGRTLEASIEATLRDFRELRLPFMQALGQEPARREPEEMDDPVE